MEKPNQINTIGVLMLISGILNIMFGLGISFGAVFLLIGILCLPLTIVPLVLGVLEIVLAAKLMRTPMPNVKFGNVQLMAGLEIASIFWVNLLSVGLGIAIFILLGDPSVREYIDSEPSLVS